MKTVKGSSVLALGATLCALIAQPGDAMAQVTCQTTFTANQTKRLTCSTSLSEDATGSAQSTEILGTKTITLSVTYRNGQDGAEAFAVNQFGTIACRTGLTLQRGVPLNRTCNGVAAPGFFRIITN